MTEGTNRAELVKAADARVSIPDVNNIRALAKDLLDSGMFPGVKTIAGAVTIIQAGFELGVPPVSALNTMVIINGRLAMEAKLLLAVAANRVGVTWKIKEDANGCSITFSRPGFEPVIGEFTRSDAQKANLLGKQNWTLYEKDMFFARAAGRGIKRIAPDAILGMVTKEEAEDFVDFDAAPKPVSDKAATDAMTELDELKKKVAGLTAEQAAYEAKKAEPLNDIKDEFTDPPEEKPAPEAPCSMAQVATITDLAASLEEQGVAHAAVWKQLEKKIKEKFNLTLTEPSDLNSLQADELIAYLRAWLNKVMKAGPK